MQQTEARAAIASAKTVAAVERLARADRRIAATVEQWDIDPWALNTPRRRHRLANREDAFASRRGLHHANHGRRAEARGCPLFLAFLDRITDGDAELVSYLQRVLGYALTGLTKEHALFFAYGTGANGKSVFLSTVSGVLADYHKTAAPETFTVSHNDRHLSELARLRGAADGVRHRDGGRPTLGRKPDQTDDGRRRRRRQFHAAGPV